MNQPFYRIRNVHLAVSFLIFVIIAGLWVGTKVDISNTAFLVLIGLYLIHLAWATFNLTRIAKANSDDD